ncbi:MAG: helix-turn-helix transcriptional regulator [Blautia sp.]|nr:helix-turn-helix transcriptional regulator [Blautia sp.]MCM1200270.1 helix-turn-helix transcriptional regulator [Bacteroides fragilis]
MEFYRLNADVLPDIHFVDDTVIEPPFVHKRRKAGEYVLYAVRSGELYLAENDVPLILKEGDVCILDKDRTHAGTRATECSYFYVHFRHRGMCLLDGEEMAGVLLEQREKALKSDIFSYDACEGNVICLPKCWHIQGLGDRVKLFAALEQAKQENYNPLENYKILCACQIQQMFIQIGRSFLTAKQEQQAVKLPAYYAKAYSLMEWINREYAAPVTGKMLEEKFHGNFDYMNRTFKKVMGQTIFQYLTQVRINHARMLVVHTNMRMNEIGEKVGFPDEYYFNKIFKRYVGMPPASYARNYQA